MSKHVHHINAAGTAVVCTAPEISLCRTRPQCDAEGWNRTCGDHNGAHRALPGADCWLVEWINGADMLPETYGDCEATPEIIPGAAVEIEFLGSDEGCSWTYIEDPLPAEMTHRDLDDEMCTMDEAGQQETARFKALWAEAEKRGVL